MECIGDPRDFVEFEKDILRSPWTKVYEESNKEDNKIQTLWKNSYNEAPEDNELVFTYFEPLNMFEVQIHVMTEFGSCFQSNTGFLTDEEVWWMKIPALPFKREKS